MNKFRPMLTAAGLGFLLACSGGSGGGEPVTHTGGNLSVHLVGAPGDGVQALSLAIQKVELSGPQGWVTVASPNASFSLVSLVDGSSAALATGGNLPGGAYTSLRLTLGPGSTAQLAGGNALALAPVAQAFIIPCNLTIGSNSNGADLTLIVDPGRSVQPKGSTLVFAPELRAVDRIASGSITGKFTDSSGQPIVGALVTAQYFQGFGEPVIQRRTLTHTDGSYSVDLLPFGTPCYVVCFPQIGARIFSPKASAAFTPQAGAPTATFTTSFTAQTVLGSFSGTVTPVTNSNQGDEIQLFFGPILAGGEIQSFIINTSPGILVGSAETWAFPRLPVGSTYQLRAKRHTWPAEGAFVEQTHFSEDYAVSENQDFPYDFFF